MRKSPISMVVRRASLKGLVAVNGGEERGRERVEGPFPWNAADREEEEEEEERVRMSETSYRLRLEGGDAVAGPAVAVAAAAAAAFLFEAAEFEAFDFAAALDVDVEALMEVSTSRESALADAVEKTDMDLLKREANRLFSFISSSS